MKKILLGKVISVKMTNSIVVEVSEKFRHPLYQKIITRHKKYKASREGISLVEGDEVKIQESRPVSKTINFRVLEKITK